jgi:hypothetical protein
MGLNRVTNAARATLKLPYREFAIEAPADATLPRNMLPEKETLSPVVHSATAALSSFSGLAQSGLAFLLNNFSMNR